MLQYEYLLGLLLQTTALLLKAAHSLKYASATDGGGWRLLAFRDLLFRMRAG